MSDDDGNIAVQPQAATPRLLSDGNASPPVPGAPPFEPATADPMVSPAEIVPKWAPGEAAQLVTGAHNAAGGLYLTATNRGRYFDRWRAEAKELDDSSAAIARLLDRVAPPGAQGPVGLLGDGLMAANGVIAMLARHALAVREAQARDLENVTYTPGEEPPGAARPARAPAPQPRPPATGPTAAPRPTPAPAGEAPPAARRGYALPPEYAAFLGAQPAHDHPITEHAA